VELLRVAGPLVLAIVAAVIVDRAMARRGTLPLRFADELAPDAPTRRALGALTLAAILWAGAFAPLSAIGEPPPDLSQLTIPRLFVMHGLLVAAVFAWYALGYLPRRADVGPGFLEAFGLRTADAGRELAIGTGVGLAIWMVVLLLLLALAALISLLGGRDALPAQPPEVVLWIGGLPVWARVAVAVSAGLVEETFFRGFLQPRVGVALSTILFALAHVGYGQPFLLVGVTLLSLFYAQLARRRGSVWAPIAAHAVFDLVQLLVVVPLVSRTLDDGFLPERVVALAVT
jgi:membrane protease YdiL (CAAX protease family)